MNKSHVKGYLRKGRSIREYDRNNSKKGSKTKSLLIGAGTIASLTALGLGGHKILQSNKPKNVSSLVPFNPKFAQKQIKRGFFNSLKKSIIDYPETQKELELMMTKKHGTNTRNLNSEIKQFKFNLKTSQNPIKSLMSVSPMTREYVMKQSRIIDNDFRDNVFNDFFENRTATGDKAKRSADRVLYSIQKAMRDPNISKAEREAYRAKERLYMMKASNFDVIPKLKELGFDEQDIEELRIKHQRNVF